VAAVKALVVLPTYNEAGTIEEVISGIQQAVPGVEVLVVDDSSPDGTAEVAEKIGAESGGVHVLRRPRRLGLGSAYREGFAWGLDRGAEALVEMDSDLSHDPGELPRLLAALDDCELAIGSRYVPGGSIPQWGLHRRLLSRLGNWYSSFMLGLDVRDLTAGYRAYRAEALRGIDLGQIRADGYGFQIEMAYRVAQNGGRIREVPSRFVDREIGESKMSSRIVVEALLLVTRMGVGRLWRRLSKGHRS
jgi:dolichol-phosphate mannosyltransferase